MQKFTLNTHETLLNEAIFIPSPNHNNRPDDTDVDLIVIHGISLPPKEFGTKAVEAFFCNQLNFALHPYYQTIAHLQVSSHLFIKRTGEVLQFVPFNKRAWHAGESQFEDRQNCNDFSIGIELEGTDDIPYEVVQYEQLAYIIQTLKKCYPKINDERIVGHSDIAPGRKTDPGPFFDWQLLKGLLA